MKRNTRNLGIIAHVDAGKTTLSERVLLYTGRIRAVGETHDGAARLDHEAQEKAHGITITAAAVTCQWRDHWINLIDTPGHVDFTIEVERSLRVLDGAVVVFDGVAGVEAQTETVWRQADRYRVPRVCFVNKLDRVDANFDGCLEEIRETLGARAVAVTLPLGAEDRLAGVVDLVAMQALIWDGRGDGSTFETRPLSAAELAAATPYHEALVEACADHDGDIFEALVAGDSVSVAALRRALRAATCASTLVPVLGGSAYRNMGVQPLLDAVVDYLPSPEEGEPLVSLCGEKQRGRVESEPLTALCFKVVFDRHGQTSFVRVYSGAVERGDRIVSSRAGAFRVSRLVRLFAGSREEVSRLEAGDIGAIVGPPLATGDTLHAPNQAFALESIALPSPLASVSVEAETAAEDDKLGGALGRLVRADPSLRVITDNETGERRLSGMGQLHLEIAAEKLVLDYGVRVRIGKPTVAYRQTIAEAKHHSFTLRKQSGGPGMFAHIELWVAPGEPGSGLVFSDEISGGAIPREMIRGVAQGVEAGMASGVSGIPIVDVVVVLVDGSTHVKDSSELAFRIAGERAIVDAAKRSGLTVLEPIAKLRVDVAEDATGLVVGDLGRRRGRVQAISVAGGRRILEAVIPLAETFGYAGALSSMTGGRGQFVIEPAGYQPC